MSTSPRGLTYLPRATFKRNVLRTVNIVLGCDTDPDRESILDGIPAGTLTWRGMTDGIPALKLSLHGVTDSAGHEPIFTWLIRADEQVRDIYGEYASVIRTHHALLRALEESGDEIGWHPHFWRRGAEGTSWYQDVEDIEWQVEMLQKAHADLVSCLPAGVDSVRMGWDYHNNHTYKALEQLGILVDFSAIPGLRTFTGTPPTRGENIFDWHTTPRFPFRPSLLDYRRRAFGNEGSRQLLEVPNFVSRSILWGTANGIQLARKTRDWALLWHAMRRPTYWINVTARPLLFAPLVNQLRRLLRTDDLFPIVFSTYFHPDELMPNKSRLYSLSSVRSNLEALLQVCDEAAVTVHFQSARQIPALFPNDR